MVFHGFYLGTLPQKEAGTSSSPLTFSGANLLVVSGSPWFNCNLFFACSWCDGWIYMTATTETNLSETPLKIRLGKATEKPCLPMLILSRLMLNLKYTPRRLLGGGFKHFLVSPLPGEKTSNLTRIFFEGGWHHHLDSHRTWKWWFGRWFCFCRGPVFSGSSR